ncbi:fumarylacetoacetate hydrolase [Thermomonospora echinospora]|uniref:fumarylacetoacetase n=1 Tax=Thermomonospora echinospora TaxID=1992 RepID=A0A1H6DKT1_9ACTN|nr:fumarylacetoacetase [Thermomonospora echinospora]SEG85749.1 fumarylacetoacetate hydrolase [Thermomonospora echinospora]
MTDVSWAPVPEDSGFGIENLPYGVFTRPGELPRIGVAIGTAVLDLAGLAADGLLEDRRWFAAGSLNGFMAAGRPAWLASRARIIELLTIATYRERVEPHLIPLSQVELVRPVEVADFADFYSSIHHAANVGQIFRPDAIPLTPNWRRLPIAYHGRAGTVYVSGTPIFRPWGQRRDAHDSEPSYGPSQRLDLEAEVGYVVGVPSAPGWPLPTSAFRDHVFGFVLVNDWSARDIQFWESQPLGPFVGKSFATSVSPWVVPVAALEAARVPPPAQDPPVLPYLRCDEPWGLDLTLEIELNGHVIARPPFSSMYWTPPQQLAHATVGGAAVRTGDLFASGTVSGAGRPERGCLLELTWNGLEPLQLPDGTRRAYLQDGDTVTIRAFAPTATGARLAMGEVTGVIHPAPGSPAGTPTPGVA